MIGVAVEVWVLGDGEGLGVWVSQWRSGSYGTGEV